MSPQLVPGVRVLTASEVINSYFIFLHLTYYGYCTYEGGSQVIILRHPKNGQENELRVRVVFVGEAMKGKSRYSVDRQSFGSLSTSYSEQYPRPFAASQLLPAILARVRQGRRFSTATGTCIVFHPSALKSPTML